MIVHNKHQRAPHTNGANFPASSAVHNPSRLEIRAFGVGGRAQVDREVEEMYQAFKARMMDELCHTSG